MINAAESMKKVLEQTGVYKIDKGSPIDSELKAYEAGFELFEKSFESLLADIFVLTASDAEIERRELLFRPLRSEETLDVRRQMLISRYSLSPNDYTREKLEQAVFGAGVIGRLSENYNGGLFLDFSKLLGINLSQALAELETVLPAHLNLEMNTNLFTWQFFDELGKTFAELEAYDYTWDEIENRTRE